MSDKDYNQLNAEEQYVILHKGTEAPFVGEYTDNRTQGLYCCKQCNSPLYISTRPSIGIGSVLRVKRTISRSLQRSCFSV